MKKRFGTLILALLLAFSLAIPVGAAGNDTQEISDAQYQEYVQIAKELSQEYDLTISACPKEEMTKAYTADEYEAEMRELCEGAPVVFGSGDSTSNPSSSGAGTKLLTVNTPINNGEGYFLIRVDGSAVVNGVSPYYYSPAPKITALTLIKRPSNEYTIVKVGTPVSGGTASAKTSAQKIELRKSGVGQATYVITARFDLNVDTGRVTMTANNVKT